MKESYYERLTDAAAELFGEGTQFHFCHVRARKHYHRITREEGREVLANVLLTDIPAGRRIYETFVAAAEALGNVDLAKIRPTLKAHGL